MTVLPMSTYCRFCLHRDADPMTQISSYTMQRFLGAMIACQRCWDYLSLISPERFYKLLRLARQYAAARFDVAA